MPQILKVKFPQKCIGCELCVFEAQRQLGKVGLEGSMIRVFRNKKENSNFLEFFIELDPRTSQLDIHKIKAICPTEVFEVVEEEEGLIE